MDKVGVLLLGLLIFLVPAALFGWSTLTERGRRTYDRALEESEKWPKMGGLIPLKPPRSSIAHWAYRKPWTAAAVVGVLEGTIMYVISRTALNDDAGAAVGNALWVAVEGFVILGLFLREFSKHYGRPRARNTK